MDQQAARAVAEQLLDEEIRSEDGPEIVIVEDGGILEYPDTWVFVYNTQAWVESREDMDMLLGNAPIFVDKTTGLARFGRTDLDIEAQL